MFRFKNDGKCIILHFQPKSVIDNSSIESGTMSGKMSNDENHDSDEVEEERGEFDYIPKANHVLSWNIIHYYQDTPEDKWSELLKAKKVDLLSLAEDMEALIEAHDMDLGYMKVLPPDIERRIMTLFEVSAENEWLMSDAMVEIVMDGNDALLICDMLDVLIRKYPQ